MADEKSRKVTEGLLSSVLISTKDGVPLHHLAREFREITLSDIPLEKLGFPSIELYLKSIPNVARIMTNDKGVVMVKGVPNENNKHIAKLVSGQKKVKKRSSAISRKPSRFASSRGRGGFSRTMGLSVTRKSRGSPRGHFGTSTHPPFPFAGRQSSNTSSFLNRSSARPTFGMQSSYQSSINRYTNDSQIHKSSTAPNLQSTSHVQSQVLREVQNLLMTVNMTSNATMQNQRAVQNFPQSNYKLPPRMKKLQQNQSMNVTDNDTEDLRQVIENRRRQSQSRDAPAGTRLSSERNMKFTIQNDYFGEANGSKSDFQDNIIKILQGYPNGLWAGVLITKYKERFGEPPKNLLEIVQAEMDSQVEIRSMVNGKAIVYLKKPLFKQTAEKEEKSPKQIVAEDKRTVIAKDASENQDKVETILDEPEEEELFIADPDIPEIEETFAAYISHVDTIDRFFVQRADSEILMLSEKIQSYYEANKRTESTWKPKIGSLCCACYFGQWYRARVIFAKAVEERSESQSAAGKGRSATSSTIQNQATVYSYTVLYLDYGNMETVQMSEIRKLRPEFCTLPVQALQCKPHGILWEGTQSEWSPQAIEYFKQITNEVLLDVRVKNVRAIKALLKPASMVSVMVDKFLIDNILDVDLMTLDGSSIADALVEKGLAICKTTQRQRTASLPTIPNISPEKGEEESEKEDILSPKPSMLQRMSSLSLDVEDDVDVVQVELPKDDAIDILVSAVNSLNEISVILLGNEYRGRLTILEAGMQGYYDCEQTEELSSVEMNSVYAAFHEEAWYRVRVTDISEDEVEIHFVDRGDSGKVQTSELRKLPSQFKRLPLQAIELTLNNLPYSDNPEHVQVLSDLILGKECVAMLVKGMPQMILADLYDTSTEEDININEQVAAQLNLHDEDAFEQSLPEDGEQCDAFVSHISDSGIFNIVVPGPGLQKLDELIDELADYFSKGAKAADIVTNPEQDKIVCTKWKEDGSMYRALITCVMAEEKKVEVEFLDYGNRDFIAFVALREIPEHLKELRTLPPQTIRCKLADCPEEAKSMWKYGLATRLSAVLKTQTVVVKTIKEATENEIAMVEILKSDQIDSSKFVSIAEDITDICTILSENSPSTMMEDEQANSPIVVDETVSMTSSSSNPVDVSRDAEPVVAELHRPSLSSQISLSSVTSDHTKSKSGLKIRNAIVPAFEIDDCWHTVHITTAQSPSKFCFQLQENIAELIILMENMLEFYQDSEDCFDKCCEGDLCAVMAQEGEETWFRGLVRSRVGFEDEDQVGVLLADFGEMMFAPIDDIRILHQKFQSFPFQAIKGSLADVSPPSMDKWPKKACKKFSELVTHKLFAARIKVNDKTYPLSYSLVENDTIELLLYDTSGLETDVIVNEKVVADIM